MTCYPNSLDLLDILVASPKTEWRSLNTELIGRWLSEVTAVLNGYSASIQSPTHDTSRTTSPPVHGRDLSPSVSFASSTGPESLDISSLLALRDLPPRSTRKCRSLFHGALVRRMLRIYSSLFLAVSELEAATSSPGILSINPRRG